MPDQNNQTKPMNNEVFITDAEKIDPGIDSWSPLTVLRDVLEQLEQRNISYCHWKSNYHLEYALTGVEDVDVLVASADFPPFVQILLAHGFKQADSVSNRMQPGVFHFLGIDGETGTLINVHAYTRILTGDHLLKSWALPLETLLLSETEQVNGMRVTTRSSELIVFVFRNMIKQTTLLDLYLSARSTHATAEEFQWLMSGLDIDDSLQKLERHFPEITAADFTQAIELLAHGGSLYDRLRLGQRFKRKLKNYRRYDSLAQSVLTVVAAGRMAANRLGRKQKHMHFLTGGKIIALVGPQATGKSTLAAALKSWLGQELAVRTIHAGKPPATWLTFLPNVLIPVLKSMLPGYSSVKIEKESENENFSDYPLIFLVRKIMLAHERYRLLRTVYQQSRNGKLIISDRYPSDVVGAIDGATFRDEAIKSERSFVKRFLMQWERSIYRKICPPDLVLQLTVSVEMAVMRNRTRDNKGGQTTEYVRTRHSMLLTPEFYHSPVIQLSTDRDFEETLLEVKHEVWKHL
jgi:thymidylate kinase